VVGRVLAQNQLMAHDFIAVFCYKWTYGADLQASARVPHQNRALALVQIKNGLKRLVLLANELLFQQFVNFKVS